MKKIKYIDLLNMIAKGEKLPKKIKVDNFYYRYDKDEADYIEENCGWDDLLIGGWNYDTLNEEVEVIEDEAEYYQSRINDLKGEIEKFRGRYKSLEECIINKFNYAGKKKRENKDETQIRYYEGYRDMAGEILDYIDEELESE